MTPIYYIDEFKSNHIYIKRDDFIPFSFGGNKARKAELFFKEIDDGGYNCVVTYGSSSSNHCRIVSNACCQREIPCYIICPNETSETTFNTKMMKLFGAEVITVSLDSVSSAIEKQITDLKRIGKVPYFIEGGGHGTIGTEAYVRCYYEIKDYEKQMNVFFDYIFFASGTGTTQAGLICGQLLCNDVRNIIGISIARKNPRGRNIVLDSIRTYLGNKYTEEIIQKATNFIDDYTFGYGNNDSKVIETINYVMKKYGIPMDVTYTGKAFNGMTEYVSKERIEGKNILFIHTGGTPLYFDFLRKQAE